jgi:uncharacterized protein (TIGR00162 family)
MVCLIEMFEKPRLRNPVMIEGLPGIGFVANIATLHLIHELKAERFAEIHSSAFQDLAVTTEEGKTRSPLNELYFSRGKDGERDFVIWYGNTQALTTGGQYELCGRVLDIAKELDCKYVITLGGFRQEEVKSPPQIYCAASDQETLQKVLALGPKIMVGQVFGIAGIMVGLARLRGVKSFSLLVDTLGTYPDAEATKAVLMVLNSFLGMKVDLSKLELAAAETKKILESFGLIRNVGEEKKREEQQFRWFI